MSISTKAWQTSHRLLFNKRYCQFLPPFSTVSVHQGSPDKIQLPPLPPYFQAALQTYRETTFNIYKEYVNNFCKSYPKVVLDNALPWSNISFCSMLNLASGQVSELGDLNFLMDERRANSDVSLFIATTGCSLGYSLGICIFGP